MKFEIRGDNSYLRFPIYTTFFTKMTILLRIRDLTFLKYSSSEFYVGEDVLEFLFKFKASIVYSFGEEDIIGLFGGKVG